jgi:lipopolysaccharide transport system permease protein
MNVDTPEKDPPSPGVPQVSPGAQEVAAPRDTIEETVIEARPGWKFLDLTALWRYRELLFFLAWRDVKVRYKQTLLGAAWAILQPTLMMVVFSVFLGKLAGLPSGGFPYPVFVYAGLLPWTFFATALANAGNSVVASEQLITKVYFPRLIIPFSAVGAALVDFAMAFLVLFGLMLFYSITPTLSFLLLPLLVVLATLAALGVGTFLAALNVSYRDFRYLIPFLLQLWMFATPSIYMQNPEPAPEAAAAQAVEVSGTDALLSTVRRLLDFNPMTGLIAFFRSAILGGRLPWDQLAFSGMMIVALFAVGCYYFRRVEDSFADII